MVQDVQTVMKHTKIVSTLSFDKTNREERRCLNLQIILLYIPYMTIIFYVCNRQMSYFLKTNRVPMSWDHRFIKIINKAKKFALSVNNVSQLTTKILKYSSLIIADNSLSCLTNYLNYCIFLTFREYLFATYVQELRRIPVYKQLHNCVSIKQKFVLSLIFFERSNVIWVTNIASLPSHL